MTDTPITTAREMCEAAARAVGDLRGRDVPRRDAEDAADPDRDDDEAELARLTAGGPEAEDVALAWRSGDAIAIERIEGHVIRCHVSPAGLVYAVSDTLPELMAGKPDLDALRAVLPQLVRELLDLRTADAAPIDEPSMIAPPIADLASRIPEPGEDDVERVLAAAHVAFGLDDDVDWPDHTAPYRAEVAERFRAALSAMRPAPAEGWRPIETAPKDGEFLAENKHGDWLRVRRYDNPFGNENTVLNERTGRWFSPKRWMPLPVAMLAAPAQGGRDE